MRSSSIVLLSGGLDSLASLQWALQESDLMFGLTFNYGQRAAEKEIETSANICHHFDVKHLVVELPWFSKMSRSALIDSNQALPELTAKDLGNAELTKQSADAVWVPNRNGALVNVAASIAEARCANWIVVGFNHEEAQTFPDNSKGFIDAVNESLKYSTRDKVILQAPMSGKSKKEIIEWGMAQDLDFSNLWSCYLGGDKMCGECESCLRCKRAFREAGAVEWVEKLF